MAAAVVRTDTVAALSTIGVRRKGNPAHVSPSDKFYLASNGKAVTATAIAYLVEEDEVSWSTTPVDVWPNMADSIDPAFRSITLEQLLSHRAGIPPFTSGDEWESLPSFGEVTDANRAFSKYLLQQEPKYSPGSQFLYSNAGYAIAAEMAEVATGSSLEETIRRHLFRPLGVEGGFGRPAARDSTQPWGHWKQGGDTLRVSDPGSPYQPGEIGVAAGDMHMTVSGYARFLQLHLRGLRNEETRLLNPAAIQNLHKSRGAMADSSGGPGYGLGWIVLRDSQDAQSSHHSGSGGRFKVKTAIHPTQNIAAAVLANAGGEEADRAVDKALSSLVKRYGSSN
jgi:CubicO group peptidase (beta-lactamase class C family)